MAAFKDKSNSTWYVQFRYTDWKGERQQKFKRGFATKREAQAWERQFLMQKQADVNMTFESFITLYEKDMKPRLKLNTWLSKAHVIQSKILPYFRKRKLSEITARDVIDWQNEIRQLTKSDGTPYSPDYLRNVHTQLSCIFNHAVRYYGLQVNPASRAGSMGGEQPKEMLFWTKEEYLKFAEAMMDKPMLYYAFEILYWCGIREGELLALTREDFDLEARTLRINKSYQRLQGKDVITTPKTKKSNRVIQMPDFLCDEIQDYFQQFFNLEDGDRVFPLTRHILKGGMTYGCKHSGVKEIRIHDLRHSHVSLLINMGYSAVAIGNRVGHESVEITYGTSPLVIEPADVYIATIDPAAPWQLTSEPVCILRPRLGWDRCETEVEEGPYLLRHGDDLFVTVSGSSTGMSDLYAVGLLRAKAGSDLLNPASWDCWPYPLLTKESVPGEFGPGHNNFVKDPETGDDLMVYHAVPHDAQGRTLHRHPAMRRVHWSASGLPCLEMTPEKDLDPRFENMVMKLIICAKEG